MNATELHHADGKSTGIFYCATCRVVHRHQEVAEKCCTPHKCDDCGCELDPKRFRTICCPCEEKKRLAKKLARFDAAEKLTDYDGPVFDEDSDMYHATFVDYVEYTEGCVSPYVWACKVNPIVRVTVDDILEGIANQGDLPEDFATRELDGQKELEVALDAFNAANASRESWTPDYKRAVLIGEIVEGEA